MLIQHQHQFERVSLDAAIAICYSFMDGTEMIFPKCLTTLENFLALILGSHEEIKEKALNRNECMRFEHLDEYVEFCQKTLHEFRGTMPLLPPILSKAFGLLDQILLERWEQTRDQGDLDRAIFNCETQVSMTRDYTDTEARALLHHWSALLETKYEASGTPEYLQKAINAATRAQDLPGGEVDLDQKIRASDRLSSLLTTNYNEHTFPSRS